MNIEVDMLRDEMNGSGDTALLAILSPGLVIFLIYQKTKSSEHEES